MRIFLIVLAIIAVIAAIILAFNWKNWFGNKPLSEKDKCLATNKTLTDGTDCTNCAGLSANTSGSRVTRGIIKNGICIEKPAAVKKYIISNKNGAIPYSLQGSTFVAPINPVNVPFNTEIKILSISPKKDYVNTSYGWISMNDIQLI